MLEKFFKQSGSIEDLQRNPLAVHLDSFFATRRSRLLIASEYSA